MGRSAEALEHIDAVLEIRSSALGARHALVGDTLRTKAVMQSMTGQLEGAIESAQQAFEIAQDSPGDQSVTAALAADALGSLLLAKGDPQDAIGFFQRAATIMEARRGPSHPDLVAPLSNLGTAEHRMGHYEAAKVAHERALEVVRGAMAPADSARIDVGRSLAADLIALHAAAAVPLLRDAVEELSRQRYRLADLADAEITLAEALVGAGAPKAEVESWIESAERHQAEATGAAQGLGPQVVSIAERAAALRSKSYRRR